MRSAGIKKDLRILKSSSYAYYWFLKFRSFLGKTGDCFDRFIIRIREMLESIYIIYQVIPNFLTIYAERGTKITGIGISDKPGMNNKSKSMENLIEHFKYYSEGLKVNPGMTYKAVEAPKGEFGVTLISDGSKKPFRCKIRTPAYHHLQYMSNQIEGHYFADMITILGSQDIVFGEVDR